MKKAGIKKGEKKTEDLRNEEKNKSDGSNGWRKGTVTK